MTYSVKEIFYTLQGEGVNAGRPAVFCRFAGCNLWTGREEERSSAACRFCDTDFVGTDGTAGGKYPSATHLASTIASHWKSDRGQRFVVLTGGEPLLQIDQALIEALHKSGFRIAVETNGTIEVPPDIDWICVSPKAGVSLKQLHGNELKVVFPQDGQDLEQLAQLRFDHHLLQPMDGPFARQNTRLAVEKCLGDPRWSLSLQTHKTLGIR